MKLHELPEANPARNTAIQNLDVRIVFRHTRSSRDPRTWKIKNDTYNRLNETWKTNFDFILNNPTN